MKAKIEFVGRRSIFSNDDLLTVEVVVKRRFDEPYFSNLIGDIELRLLCEGCFVIGAGTDDKATKVVTYYESEPVIARCNYTTRGHVIYSGQLRFPSSDAVCPSSLSYDGRRVNSIKWLVRAKISRSDTAEQQTVERSCIFRPTAPLPSLLDLVDTVHSEVVDSSEVRLVTTHAAAGLPQVPLAAGLSFSIECDTPGKFKVMRLRLLLHESNTVRVGDRSLRLPLRRWLLEDFRPYNHGIVLRNRITNLDRWVGDIHVDHATLAPSYQTKNLQHTFDMVVDVALSWASSSGRQVLTRRISSVSPIIILPRVSGMHYGPPSPASPLDGVPHTIFDPAEITDTTDEDELDVNALGEVIERGTDRTSAMSSDSAQSVLSDHIKVDVAVVDKMMSPIVTTTALCDL